MSASSILVNKGVMSSWNFNFQFTMVLCQLIVSYTLLYSLRAFGLISFPDWSLATAKQTAPLAICHLANVLVGLFALELVDVPMFG